jgi:hypothetical protein
MTCAFVDTCPLTARSASRRLARSRAGIPRRDESRLAARYG